MEGKKSVKDRRATFRMSPEEYERFKHNAIECGMDMSTYIRACVLGGVDRVFYDPDMTGEIRKYRREIRALVQEIAQIRRRVDNKNYVLSEELQEIDRLVKSVYGKMDDITDMLGEYQRELMANGDNQAS